MVLCGRLLIKELKKSWLWRSALMRFRMQLMHKEHSVKLSSFKNLTVMKISFDYKTLFVLKTIKIFTWYLILWTLIYMLLSELIFWKKFINSISFISLSSHWNIFTLLTCCIEIWNQAIYFWIPNVIWKFVILGLQDLSITANPTLNQFSPIM